MNPTSSLTPVKYVKLVLFIARANISTLTQHCRGVGTLTLAQSAAVPVHSL